MLHRFIVFLWVLGWDLATVPALAQQLQLPPPLRQILPPAGLDLVSNRMTEDAHGHLWLATDGGLGHFNGQRLEGFHDPRFPQGDEYSTAIATPDGRVWLLLGNGGLAYYDPARRRIAHLPDTTRLMREFVNPKGIRALYVDRQGQLWLGLRDRGLLRVDPKTLATEHFFSQPRTVCYVAEAPDGRVWFTTDHGVYVLDRRTGQSQGFFHDPRNPNTLGSNATLGIHVRPDGLVLVSMYHQINALNPSTGHVRRIQLPRSSVTERLWTHDFKPDAQGNAYFSVGRGVYRYTMGGQLQRIEFARPTEQVISIEVSRLGKLYVNVGRRLDEYDLRGLRAVPPLHLLDVVVNGTRLVENQQPAEDRLQRDTTGMPRLRVREGDIFQLYFAPSVERRTANFRVQLVGYDQQWVAFRDSMGLVTYQPPAGDYTFLLNVAKSGGGWEASSAPMRVVVEPPFYKTGWFLTLATILVATGLGLLYRTVQRRQKLRRELAQREVEADNLRKLDRLKSQFFSNITHEFRTPLTLILASAEQLGKRLTDESSQVRVSSIERNARQLLRLITQILDTSKLDAGSLDVKRRVGNPVAFVEQLVQSFAGMAEKKGITLSFQSSSADCSLSFDDEKLEMIGYNLLSNALKFTPEGGRIDVRCGPPRGSIDERFAAVTPFEEKAIVNRIAAANRSYFVIQVSDTGPGIAREHVSRIFERFYQVDATSTRAFDGTGIGLAFVRELTELLGGTVSVESTVGEGSIFTVQLPMEWVGSEAPPADPSDCPEGSAPLLRHSLPAEPSVSAKRGSSGAPPSGQSDGSAGGASKPLVLVVEDNEELREFIIEQLTPDYQVLAAMDGRAGLEQALVEIPDLILSDVMMPRLDGYSLLSTLKADQRTSHIPVILLTAKSSYDSKLHGLGMGADAYLSKPFGLDELALTLRNTLQTRRAWQAILTANKNQAVVNGSVDPIPEGEKLFLDRLRQILLRHLKEEAVDVDWLAGQVNLSRSQLHRKLTALTNHSATWFINHVRLERAEELLREGLLNVTEVAYEVGYNSQPYFTRVFQEHFGYSPTKVKV